VRQFCKKLYRFETASIYHVLFAKSKIEKNCSFFASNVHFSKAILFSFLIFSRTKWFILHRFATFSLKIFGLALQFVSFLLRLNMLHFALVYILCMILFSKELFPAASYFASNPLFCLKADRN